MSLRHCLTPRSGGPIQNELSNSPILRRGFLLGATALPLAACSAPVQLSQSNKDPVYGQKLDRVLVTKAFHDRSMTETNKKALVKEAELKQSFAAKWVPLGLSIETLDLDAAGDKAKATMADAMVNFRPSQLLQLKTANFTTASYVLDGYAIDASLFDVVSKKRVWRGVVQFKTFAQSGRMRNGPLGSEISHQDDANDLVDALTVKLKADGLL